jgi:hypothetical protein
LYFAVFTCDIRREEVSVTVPPFLVTFETLPKTLLLIAAGSAPVAAIDPKVNEIKALKLQCLF